MPGDPWPFPPLAQAPIYMSAPTICEHCWCETAHGWRNHAQCCKCRTRMHRKFIPALAEPKTDLLGQNG